MRAIYVSPRNVAEIMRLQGAGDRQLPDQDTSLKNFFKWNPEKKYFERLVEFLFTHLFREITSNKAFN